MNPNIIGITSTTGPGSGKDEVATMIQYISSECSNIEGKHYRDYATFKQKITGNIDYSSWYRSEWENRKLSFKLKKMCSIILGIPEDAFEDRVFKERKLGKEWDYMTVRDLMIRVGEGMREKIHKDIWINALFEYYTGNDKWIISDVRYINEAKRIKKYGGVIVNIVRFNPDFIPNSSESEMSNYQDIDYTIFNNGDKDFLLECVRLFLESTKII